jgi:NhaA family Na+:H+ antiporter
LLALFLRSESAGGALLILASLGALAWSNSADAPAYASLLRARLGYGALALNVHEAVNQGLMSLFFLLAALEIRREMTSGRLATLRGAAAPGIAALGGMVVPALIYLAVTRGHPAAARGWAVPVATDIAFSLAVLRVLGRRASQKLRVFLTALAILDDLGAIAVIALFYTAGLSAAALGGAAALWLALWGLGRAGVRALWPYLVGGAGLWLLVRGSGVHATLAGVALAFVVPGRPDRSGAASAADRLEHALAPWVAYGVLPIFGLANAGLDLHGMHAAILLSPAPLGVVLGLVLGKQAGVFGATLLGRRLGVLTLPAAMGLGELYGGAVLCGIGFTMSLFIGDLAFRATPALDGIKLAVFCGSALCALGGAAVLVWVGRR